MEKLTNLEKEYFDMLGKEPVKISVNLSSRTLEVVDDLSKAVSVTNKKITRTLVIEALINSGIKRYIEIIEKGIKLQKPETEKQKESLSKMEKSLKDFKTKWTDLV